jgi:manganese/zinc/iron transport system permease protein
LSLTSGDVWTMATAACCSVACGTIGCFLVLRRLSLLGDAIAHAILPGLAVAFLLSGTRDLAPMLAGAVVAGLLTAALSAGLQRWGGVEPAAAIGVVFTTLFALGVVLISLVARSVDLDPGCVLYGLLEFVPLDTVTVAGVPMPRTFLWLAGMMLVNLLAIGVFFRELRLVSFDPALAAAMGISVGLVHHGLLALVTATAVVSFEAVGSILVVIMLVAPGATAHLLAERLAVMVVIAAAVAASAAMLGCLAAIWLDTSVAGMIAMASMGIFAAATLVAPRHGVVARWSRTRRPSLQTTP